MGASSCVLSFQSRYPPRLTPDYLRALNKEIPPANSSAKGIIDPEEMTLKMRILSLHTGKIGTLTHKEKDYPSAIRKTEKAGPLWLGKMGLEGDEIGNPKVHGGEGRALYIFGKNNYSLWQGKIPQELLRTHGAFGENVTLESLNEFEMFVGDRFKLGEAVIEATTPRFPCFLFAEHVRFPDAQKFMNENKHSGVLFRVISEGKIARGNSLTLVSQPQKNLRMTDFLHWGQAGVINQQFLDEVLKNPIIPQITKDRLEFRLLHGR